MTNLIDKIKSKLTNIPVELIEKRRKNQPDSFYFLGKDEQGNYTYKDIIVQAIPIGEERSVIHLTLHDMMPHAVECQMTDLRYLEGLDANAVYVDHNKFERLDKFNGKTFYQPMKILNPL